MAHSKEKGSEIAKAGFKAEHWVVNQFNSWKTSDLAQQWIISMDYVLEEIETISAQVLKIKDAKTDVIVEVLIHIRNSPDVQNIQVKLVSNKKGFNQVDKRRLINYKDKFWEDIPEDTYNLLEYFCGEKLPYKSGTRDCRRMFLSEMTIDEQQIIVNWFKLKKNLIVSDVIRGRGKFAAEWIMVINNINGQLVGWSITNVNLVVDYMSEGDVVISTKGNLCIGRITMQRKGGDNGRESAKSLQFKEDPMVIYNRFKQ